MFLACLARILLLIDIALKSSLKLFRHKEMNACVLLFYSLFTVIATDYVCIVVTNV